MFGTAKIIRGLPAPALRGWRRLDIVSIRHLLLYAVLVCATLTSATLLMSFSGEGVETAAREGGGNSLRQSIYVLCVVGTLFATRPLDNPGRIVPFPPRLFALLALCLLSLTWSATPFVGLRRLMLTFIVVWLMFRVVDELGYRRAMTVMAMTLIGILVANYLAIATTGAAVHSGVSAEGSLAGNWRGILPHKNDAGPVTAVTILLLTFGCGRMRPALRVLAIVAAAYFLIRTQSKTSLGLVGVGAVFGAAYMRYNPNYRILLAPIVLVAGAAAIYAAFTYGPPFLASLDSSQDAFTGRIQIWQTMIGYLRDHPMLGAGFGSFWDSGPVSPANIYGRSWVASAVAQGHNGYLDNWTQLGIFGMIFTVCVLFMVPLTKLLVTRNIPRAPGATAIAVLIFQFGHNFTESSMLMRDFFGNLMLSFVVACVENMVRTHKYQMLNHAGVGARAQHQRSFAT